MSARCPFPRYVYLVILMFGGLTTIGWHGNICDKPCPNGFFGMACTQMCQCQNGGVCNKVSGTCDCTPGWKGIHCTQRCSYQTYGSNCDKTCQCLNAGICDPQNGSCDCPPGRHGLLCELKCLPDTYGPNCRQRCNCLPAETCDSVTGNCACHSSKARGIGCEVTSIFIYVRTSFANHEIHQRLHSKDSILYQPLL